MPKVVQYAPNQVSTQIPGQVVARASSTTPGLELAKGLQNVVSDLQVMQERADKAEAEEAITLFEREKNKRFFDPEAGYFNTEGRTAYDSAQSMSDGLDELQRSYSENLSPGAQQMFNRVASRQVTSGKADVMRHATKGLESWEIGAAGAVIENSMESAALNWNNSERVGVQRALGRQQIVELGTMKGQSAEEINESLQNYDSSFTSGVIQSALGQSSKDAESMLEKHGDMLEPQDLAKVNRAIEAKKKSEETQNKSQRVVTAANRIVSDYKDDPSGAFDAITSEDPEIQRDIRREVQYQLNQLEKIDTQETLDTYEAVDNEVRKGLSLEGFKVSNPDQWESLTPAQKNNLEKLASGKGSPPNWDLWMDISMTSDEDLAKMSKDQVMNVTSELSKDHRNKLATRLKGIYAGDEERLQGPLGQTVAGHMKNTVRQIMGGDKKMKKDPEQTNFYYALIDDEYNKRKESLGRELTTDELKQLTGDFTRSLVVEGFIFDSETTLKDIDAEDLTQIRNAMGVNDVQFSTDFAAMVQRHSDHFDMNYDDTVQTMAELRRRGLALSRDNIKRILDSQ